MTTNETRQHFLNLSYATLGFLTGIIGNIWVYYFSKWLEKRYPSLDWNWVFYVSTIIFVLWLFFWIRFILRGLRRCTSNKEKEERKKTEIDEEEEPEEDSLIAEYQILNEFLEKRRSNTLLVMSIMLPSSLLIAGFAINQKGNFLAVLASILAWIWVLVSWIFYHTKNKLDKICWNRIKDIERRLHIKGHKHIQEELKCKMWYKVRCYMWQFFHLLLVIIYFSIMVWLMS